MSGSLNLRLTISASLVLAAFLGLAGVVLERAYKEGSVQALREQLKIHIYAILSAAELDQAGAIQMPTSLPESRFSTPGSGLLAVMFDHQGALVWRSQSNLGKNPLTFHKLATGETKYTYLENGDYATGIYAIHYRFVWEDRVGHEHFFTVAIAEDAASMLAQVSGFRNTLWSWLGTVALLLILAQAAILRWSLMPLRTISRDLKAIEDGRKKRLDDNYPKELQKLASNINILIDSERSRLERYRNTLADLAHSLKTPLAILRGCGENGTISGELKQTLCGQVDRMDELVEYQLKRAAASGHQTLAMAVMLSPVLEKIIRSLDKVYVGKKINWQLDLSKNAKLFCEEGDLYEIFGNLLDNGCKWSNGEIKIHAEAAKAANQILVTIADNGPGIPEEQLDKVMGRGVRADEQVKGHGIGLAVVKELVTLSEGSINGSKGPLGGIVWQVVLPGKMG